MPWVIIISTKYIGVWPSELRMACHYTFLQSWFLLGILIRYSAEQKRQSSTTLSALGFKYVTAGRFGLMEVGQKSGNGGEVNGKNWKGRKKNLIEFRPLKDFRRFVLCCAKRKLRAIYDRQIFIISLLNHKSWWLNLLWHIPSVDSPGGWGINLKFSIW